MTRRHTTNRRIPGSTLLAGILLFLPTLAGAVAYPPLSTEISSTHPLFIFSVHVDPDLPPESLSAAVSLIWERVPGDLRPYSALRFDAGNGGTATRVAQYQTAMETLQPLGIPFVLTLRTEDARERMSPQQLESLLSAHTNIRGIDLTGFKFDAYPRPDESPLATTQDCLWLTDLAHVAAQYGRYTHMAMDGMHWARAMSNVTAAPFYLKLRECRDYVIPSAWQRGYDTIPAQAATMGLWLEAAATFWGVASDARWYEDAPFLSPGHYGRTNEPNRMPGALYRAMILNGAMAGANVFAFQPAGDLWGAPETSPLEQHIFPVLQQMLLLSLLPDAAMVLEHAPLAYQLAPAATPVDFQASLRDWSTVLDLGLLARVAYAPVQAGAVPELVPNRKGSFWIPILSTHATEEARSRFQTVLESNPKTTEDDWRGLLSTHMPLENTGGPFLNEVGRGLFVLNTRENFLERQPFEVASLPAPIRGATATRSDAGVVLNWPFREGDISFSVYRKLASESRYRRIQNGLLERTFTDTTAPATEIVSYSITALTNEDEPFSGEVGFGEFRAWSRVESRMEEEIVLSPVLTEATSAAPAAPEEIVEPAPAQQAAEGETGEAAAPENKSTHQDILAALSTLRAAFEEQDLDTLMAVYSDGYEDPEGWGGQYVQRAYQWFFERYHAQRMLYQVRDWDFESFASAGTVNVQLFVEMSATAVSDVTGGTANPRAVIPITADRLVWTTWVKQDDRWQILFSNPAWPNFGELLSFATGPYDNFPVGPDKFTGAP